MFMGVQLFPETATLKCKLRRETGLLEHFPVEVFPDPVDRHPHHVVQPRRHKVLYLSQVQLLPEDLVAVRVGQVEEPPFGVVVHRGRSGYFHHGRDHVDLGICLVEVDAAHDSCRVAIQ